MIRSLLIAVLAFAVCFAAAQENVAPTLKLVLPKAAKPGSTVLATIEVTFAEGLHGYQNPPSEDYQIPVKVTVAGKVFKLVKASYPKGVVKSIGGDPKPCGVYEGTVKIPLKVTVPKVAGVANLKVTVSYQQCNDQSCFPPSTVSVTGKLLIKK